MMSAYSRGPGGPAAATGPNGAQIRQRQWGPASGGSSSNGNNGASGSGNGHNNGSGSRSADDPARQRRRKLAEIDEDEDEEEEEDYVEVSRSSSKKNGNSSSRHREDEQRSSKRQNYGPASKRIPVTVIDDDEYEQERDYDDDRSRGNHKHRPSSDAHANGSSHSASKSSRTRKTVLDDDDDEDEDEIMEVPRHRNTAQESSPNQISPSRKKSTLPQVSRSELEPFPLQRKEKPVSKGLAALREKRAAAGSGTSSNSNGNGNSPRNRDASAIVIPGRTSSAQGRTIGAGSGIGRPAQAASGSGNKSLTKALPSEVGKLYDPKDLRNRAKATNTGEDNSIVISDTDDDEAGRAAVRPRPRASKKSNGNNTTVNNGGRPSTSAPVDPSAPITIDDDDDDDDAPASRSANGSGQRDDAAFRAAWAEKKKAERAAAQRSTEAGAGPAGTAARTGAGAVPVAAAQPSQPLVENNTSSAGPVATSASGVGAAFEAIIAPPTVQRQTFDFSEFMASAPVPALPLEGASSSSAIPSAAVSGANISDSTVPATLDFNTMADTDPFAALLQTAANGPVDDTASSMANLFQALVSEASVNNGHDFTGGVAASSSGADLNLAPEPMQDLAEQNYEDAADALFSNNAEFDFGPDDGDNALDDSFGLLDQEGENGHDGEEEMQGGGERADSSGNANEHQEDGARQSNAMEEVVIPPFDHGAGATDEGAEGTTASGTVTGHASASVSVADPSVGGSQLSAAGHGQNPNEVIPETMHAFYPGEGDESQERPETNGNADPSPMAAEVGTGSNPGYGTIQLDSPEHGGNGTINDETEHMSDAEPAGNDDSDSEEQGHEEAREIGSDDGDDAGEFSNQTLNGKHKDSNTVGESTDISGHAQHTDTTSTQTQNRNGDIDADPEDVAAWGDLSNIVDEDDEDEEEYDEDEYYEDEDEEMEETFDPKDLTFTLDMTGEGQDVAINDVWDDSIMNDAWDTSKDEYEIFRAQKEAAIAAAKEGKSREEQEKAAAEAAAAMQRQFLDEADERLKAGSGKGKRKAGGRLWLESAQPSSIAAKKAAEQQAAQARRKAQVAQQAAEAAQQQVEAQRAEKAAREAKKAALRAQVEAEERQRKAAEERERIQAEAEEARLRAKASMLEKKTAPIEDPMAGASPGSSIVATDAPEPSSTSAMAVVAKASSRVPVRPPAQVFAVAAPKIKPVVPANALEQEQLAKEEELMKLAPDSQSSSILSSALRVTGLGGAAAAGKQNSAWRLASKAVAKTPNRIGGQQATGKSKAEAEEESGVYRLQRDETSLGNTLEEFLRAGSAAAVQAFKPNLPLVDVSSSASSSSQAKPSWPEDELAKAHADTVQKLMMSYYWVGHYSRGVEMLNEQRIQAQQQTQEQQHQQAASASGPSGSHS
ncbi:hypothetical protein CF327_g4872 [Tilletia walkeri]|uniref:Uncharacterized protein n=1 Tax=Tilletia walkeri TaxID=117179 RepID=A0A8X7N8A8_9BASI|nr:hypothetical protein CF327_g4872 [Tilletia walkeri]KAE8269041.1 hypothetical protein A4X09_0g3298 [Tilletia walkeri]